MLHPRQQLRRAPLEGACTEPSQEANEPRDRCRREVMKPPDPAKPDRPPCGHWEAASRDRRIERTENVRVQPMDLSRGRAPASGISAELRERADVMVASDQRAVEPPDKPRLQAADAKLPVGVVALAKVLGKHTGG